MIPALFALMILGCLIALTGLFMLLVHFTKARAPELLIAVVAVALIGSVFAGLIAAGLHAADTLAEPDPKHGEISWRKAGNSYDPREVINRRPQQLADASAADRDPAPRS